MLRELMFDRSYMNPRCSVPDCARLAVRGTYCRYHFAKAVKFRRVLAAPAGPFPLPVKKPEPEAQTYTQGDLERAEEGYRNARGWKAMLEWRLRIRAIRKHLDAPVKTVPKADTLHIRRSMAKVGANNPRFRAGMPWGEVSRLHDAGETYEAIAARFGVCKSTVKYRLRAERRDKAGAIA